MMQLATPPVANLYSLADSAVFPGVHREFDGKNGAFARLAFHADGPFMEINDAEYR